MKLTKKYKLSEVTQMNAVSSENKTDKQQGKVDCTT